MAQHWSRRRFLMASAALPAGRLAGPQPAAAVLTAGTVIDRIKAQVGIPWRPQTVDTLVAGTPDTPVTGIATTMMATFDVVQRAAADGKNMVVTHESTFFSHQDTVDAFVDDPTYRAKREFLDRHRMAVFHFHDHWHGRRPDGIATGMARALGWQARADAANPRRFTFDGIPLARFAQDIQARLKIGVMRVVGDPALPVRRVAASWGYVSLQPGAPLLADADVDVLVVGETREWELVEYAQDAITSGRRKALIMLGHVVSEQAGMEYCAQWLREFVTEVPVAFVPAPEPYWSPDRPPGKAPSGA